MLLLQASLIKYYLQIMSSVENPKPLNRKEYFDFSQNLKPNQKIAIIVLGFLKFHKTATIPFNDESFNEITTRREKIRYFLYKTEKGQVIYTNISPSPVKGMWNERKDYSITFSRERFKGK